MTDLKLVIEDTIDNVATLQDCSADQGQSVQLLGENTQPQQDKQKPSFHLLLRELSSSFCRFQFFGIFPASAPSSRMVHDQATLLELKTMFAELKDLLNQQVTHSACARPGGRWH